MKAPVVLEVSLLRANISRGNLPLKLGRESCSGPTREGVRLKIADVNYGLLKIERFESGERVLHPTVRSFRPVQGFVKTLMLQFAITVFLNG